MGRLLTTRHPSLSERSSHELYDRQKEWTLNDIEWTLNDIDGLVIALQQYKHRLMQMQTENEMQMQTENELEFQDKWETERESETESESEIKIGRIVQFWQQLHANRNEIQLDDIQAAQVHSRSTVRHGRSRRSRSASRSSGRHTAQAGIVTQGSTHGRAQQIVAQSKRQKHRWTIQLQQ